MKASEEKRIRNRIAVRKYRLKNPRVWPKVWDTFEEKIADPVFRYGMLVALLELAKKNEARRYRTYKIWYEKNSAAKSLKARQRYKIKGRNKNWANAYKRDRRIRDKGFCIKENLSNRIWSTVKRGFKSAKTMELVGCTIDFLHAHIEKQFQPGMSWENYGKWEIDHIRPCASFDLTKPEQQTECFHFSNLQPLWKLDNLKKGAKYGV